MGVGSRVRLACGLLKLWSPVVKELDMKMLKKAKVLWLFLLQLPSCLVSWEEEK
ncbi:hypothetical protein F2Q69_00027082 [Brassica cretica]|uniref:Uncharacterized protein n=2 Tax=Brassica cretica TaxID=69181 RepID=A0A8S9S0Q0_BRACR|nr:hypothetical protein F2Q69_00027082 [Brassica cretica]KAF3605492.1 hypothetical protein DY000_02045794 [Brassica cretica]